jgi:hypothetical protein
MRAVARGLVVVFVAGVAGCNQGPCDGAVPPPGMSNAIEVAPALACAIAVQKQLAGGLTWTAAASAGSGAPGAPAMPDLDGGSTRSFAISQNGYSANSECTAACGYNYNECFLPTDYLQAYAGAESATGNVGSGVEADAGGVIGAGGDGGSACPDAASVTVTCTYSSAGFCE